MKNLFFTLIISLFVSVQASAQAQVAEISFTKETHDFGTINEIDGPKAYKFSFKNTGKKPLIISNVKASCGCTTPQWTKAPIAAGKTGYIKVSFDPKNRPGPFNKSITVSSNAVHSEKKLIIKGSVKERVKTMDDKYRYTMGGLKLKSNHIAMTKVSNTDKKTEVLDIFNPTDKKIIVEFDRIPSHISLDKTKLTVNPKQKAQVKITYDALKKKDWGFVTDRILVIVNNKRDPKNRITVSADIQEDFSKLTEAQLKQAPKVVFGNTIFNFGEINEGESKSYKFTFKNEGKSDLVIRKLKSSCGCAVAKMDSRIIKAGQSSVINVTFNSKGKSGKQHKTITIITNDPKKPKVTLRVKGNVLSSQKKS